MIETLVRGKIPIVVINTVEVFRVYRLVADEVRKLNNRLKDMEIDDEYIKAHGYQVFTYDAIYGFKIESEGIFYPEEILISKHEGDILDLLKTIFEEAPAGIYIIPMAHMLFEDINKHQLTTLIIECNRKFEEDNKYLFLIGDMSQMPAEVKNIAVVIDLGFPEKKEIEVLIKEILKANDIKVKKSQFNKIVSALTGLSYKDAENSLKRWIAENNGKVKDDNIINLFKAKEELVRNSGLLEVINTSKTMDDVGGMTSLKEWAMEVGYIYNNLDNAISFGLKIPKGCLLTGITGCGKTLFAKAIANEFKLPLYRLDIGRLLGSLVGETERNTRELFKILDSVSPCVILLDEIEKMFSGISSSDRTDGGVVARLIGNMLYYMEERNKPTFFVATANDVTKLPPELLRKGRWDEIWFVDLPNTKAIIDIVKIHTKNKVREVILTEEEADVLKGFTGAEIEQLIENVFRKLFVYGRRDIKLDLLTLAEHTTPMMEYRTRDLEELRRWAVISARKAN